MQVLRYAAFSADPRGGNPAGVVLDASGASDLQMQQVAADVGYSETAFLVPAGDRRFDVRYFSPLAEVPFCGHATIASAAAYAERFGTGGLTFDTPAGRLAIGTERSPSGLTTATLTSVPPRTADLDPADLDALLAALHWAASELDGGLPPRVGYAGAWHPILAAATRERLRDLDYDQPSLGALMAARGWTTIALVWRESLDVFHARNPFPPGGVVEDPATGAAAAALGGYLRELDPIGVPATITVHQGHDLGRPSLITVGVPPDPGSGISVTGTAVPLPAP